MFLSRFQSSSARVIADIVVIAFIHNTPYTVHRTLKIFARCEASCSNLRFLYVKMTSSLPGNRDLPVSQFNLGTYWGRVLHSANISDPR